MDNLEDNLDQEWCHGGEYVCESCGEFYTTTEFKSNGGRCDCENDFTIVKFNQE